MLKRFIFAAGALLAATLATSGPASASARHAYYGHRGGAPHAYHYTNRQAAMRGRFLTRSRVATVRRAPSTGYRASGYRMGGYRVGGYRMARRGAGAQLRRGYARRYHRGGMHVAAARRDTAIRNYVGPASAYAPVSTPVGGGTQVGSASYYGGRNHTASGGFVGSATCAHRSLPFGTRVLVTNLANSRQAVLTVNDRGPFIRGRIVDVSTVAAGVLGMLHSGTAPVRLTVLGGRG